VVRFIKKETPVYKDLKHVEKFLDTVNGMKRKTLGKIQKILAKK
jgi:16S rRNA A1518/A1519 N6-dimethyltransferase RsmA/KsgA/DIM1 with predicted DNA glycosylase/AP lyase activity